MPGPRASSGSIFKFRPQPASTNRRAHSSPTRVADHASRLASPNSAPSASLRCVFTLSQAARSESRSTNLLSSAGVSAGIQRRKGNQLRKTSVEQEQASSFQSRDLRRLNHRVLFGLIHQPKPAPAPAPRTLIDHNRKLESSVTPTKQRIGTVSNRPYREIQFRTSPPTTRSTSRRSRSDLRTLRVRALFALADHTSRIASPNSALPCGASLPISPPFPRWNFPWTKNGTRPPTVLRCASGPA